MFSHFYEYAGMAKRKRFPNPATSSSQAPTTANSLPQAPTSANLLPQNPTNSSTPVEGSSTPVDSSSTDEIPQQSQPSRKHVCRESQTHWTVEAIGTCIVFTSFVLRYCVCCNLAEAFGVCICCKRPTRSY